MQVLRKQQWLVILALLCLYLVWGSTYIAMRYVIESFSPFLMGAIRFSVAGALLYVVLRVRGVPAPRPEQWLGAMLVGGIMLTVGNACMGYAEETVSTSVAAMAIATVPLLMALIAGCWGEWPTRREWGGIFLGALGVVVLGSSQDIKASPFGALMLAVSALAWALGSAWSKRLPMPTGMMASASQMLAGGGLLIIVSWLNGDVLPSAPSGRALWSLLFLIVFGSILAYSAYLYLLQQVRPALATSNTFVNPLVAMLLGVWLADERLGLTEYTALAVILAGVLMLLPFGQKQVSSHQISRN